MTGPDIDKVLAQMRTLLAIANGGSPYPEERERARERAERLMLRYSIDATTVELSAAQKRAPISHDTEVAGAYRRDRVFLHLCVYAAFGCQTVCIPHRTRAQCTCERCIDGYGWPLERWKTTGETLRVYGFQADVQMATALAEHLEPQMLAAMVEHGGSTSDRKVFASAFASRINRRLRDFYQQVLQEAEADGTGSALVLANRDAEVSAAVAAAYPNLRSARRRYLSGTGHQAGVAAANRADITLSGRKVRGKAALLEAG